MGQHDFLPLGSYFIALFDILILEKEMVIKREFLIIILALVFLLSSCGKRGELTLKAYEKPVTAQNLKALHRDNEIYITWKFPSLDRSKIKGCQLLKALSQDGDYFVLSLLKTDEFSYTDRDFTVGHKYYYKIRCISLKDIYSDDSTIIEVKPLKPPPQPDNVSYLIKDDYIVIQWQKIPKAKYNIYKSQKKGSYTYIPFNKEPIEENFFIDTINVKNIVYYTVRTLHSTDIRDESAASQEIEVNPADFIPSTPKGLHYAPLEKKIYLIWQSNPEIWTKGYRIYRKHPSENKFTLIGESIIPLFIIENMPSSVKTTYYITALGPEKESLPSELLHIDIEGES